MKRVSPSALVDGDGGVRDHDAALRAGFVNRAGPTSPRARARLGEASRSSQFRSPRPPGHPVCFSNETPRMKAVSSRRPRPRHVAVAARSRRGPPRLRAHRRRKLPRSAARRALALAAARADRRDPAAADGAAASVHGLAVNHRGKRLGPGAADLVPALPVPLQGRSRRAWCRSPTRSRRGRRSPTASPTRPSPPRSSTKRTLSSVSAARRRPRAPPSAAEIARAARDHRVRPRPCPAAADRWRRARAAARGRRPPPLTQEMRAHPSHAHATSGAARAGPAGAGPARRLPPRARARASHVHSRETTETILHDRRAPRARASARARCALPVGDAHLSLSARVRSLATALSGARSMPPSHASPVAVARAPQGAPASEKPAKYLAKKCTCRSPAGTRARTNEPPSPVRAIRCRASEAPHRERRRLCHRARRRRLEGPSRTTRRRRRRPGSRSRPPTRQARPAWAFAADGLRGIGPARCESCGVAYLTTGARDPPALAGAAEPWRRDRRDVPAGEDPRRAPPARPLPADPSRGGRRRAAARRAGRRAWRARRKRMAYPRGGGGRRPPPPNAGRRPRRHRATATHGRQACRGRRRTARRAPRRDHCASGAAAPRSLSRVRAEPGGRTETVTRRARGRSSGASGRSSARASAARPSTARRPRAAAEEAQRGLD